VSDEHGLRGRRSTSHNDEQAQRGRLSCDAPIMPYSILTLWECESFRCVVIVSKEPLGVAVQLWKGSDLLRDVPCATAGDAATLADVYFQEICERAKPT
jgi:hypothetical protein